MTARIFSTRSPAGQLLTVESLSSCTSTAAYLENIARHEGRSGYVVVCDNVTNYDAALPPEKEGESTLLVSILLRPSLSPSRGVMLTALSALALAKTAEQHSLYKPQIAWVSDIYTENKKKIGEVTLRSALHPSGLGFLYITVNFALRITREFVGKLPDIVKSVFSQQKTTLTERIANTLITEFFALYEAATLEDHAADFLDEYRERSLLRDQRIRVLRNGHRMRVSVLGIDDNARLVVATGRGKSLVLHSRSEIVDKRRSRMLSKLALTRARAAAVKEKQEMKGKKKKAKAEGSMPPNPESIPPDGNT